MTRVNFSGKVATCTQTTRRATHQKSLFRGAAVPWSSRHMALLGTCTNSWAASTTRSPLQRCCSPKKSTTSQKCWHIMSQAPRRFVAWAARLVERRRGWLIRSTSAESCNKNTPRKWKVWTRRPALPSSNKWARSTTSIYLSSGSPMKTTSMSKSISPNSRGSTLPNSKRNSKPANFLWCGEMPILQSFWRLTYN